ncbi:hypothetical protein Y032_0085g1842 [Ancylostoma ceylanicum]|uniref:GP-PDE domain-containing protein n=1 Tax=Ancylostoma ceylanicum TaxID=53326 RepID=A0A016TR15_9BILA|nr:hypothetical protein Y032_0085g1842 [Ancylostoma ceylanicum]
MIGCAIAWHLLTVILLAIVAGNFNSVLKIVATAPILLTTCFYIFKNNNVKSKNKNKFFAGLNVGGHRGSPHEAPENSIEGFMKAKQAKCELVEFDIHLSSDGIPVLIHDETTTRTSEENVAISEAPLTHIKKISLKEVSGVRAGIPTLEEAVEWCLQNNMRMIFDVKSAEPKVISHLF